MTCDHRFLSCQQIFNCIAATVTTRSGCSPFEGVHPPDWSATHWRLGIQEQSKLPWSPLLCDNWPIRSRQDFLDHLAVDVGEPEVAAGVAVSELFVVEAEQVEDRGLEVVDVDRVFGDVEAQVVGRAVGQCRA